MADQDLNASTASAGGGGDAAAASPTKEDHKTKNLNFLFTRVKEKLASLQTDYDKQTKELTDLKAAHTKLQNAHSNLTARSKANESELSGKYTAAVAAGKAEVEQLNAKMVKLKSDMQRSASVMQSELQEEICSMQSKLQATQTALSSSQLTLDSERTRLGTLLAQTQEALKTSTNEAEGYLFELRREREDRMRAQYSLSDKTKECDAHVVRNRKYDETCGALSDQVLMLKQTIASLENTSETWHHKYLHMREQKAEQKKHLKQYQLLLKYSAIATYTSSYKMKKLLTTVYNKVVQLCAEAVTQPTPSTLAAAGSPRLAGHDGPSDAHQPSASGHHSRRHSRSVSIKEMDLAQKAADIQQLRERSDRAQAGEPLSPTNASIATAESTTSPSHSNATSPTRKASNAGVKSKPSSRPSTSKSSTVPTTAATSNAISTATAGNIAQLPRYSVGRAALTDREWEISIMDLARRTDVEGKTTNLQLLHLIEDKLAILSPVVTELRSEVLSARSTSEGMFQRTLQLSRKNMQVGARFEREKQRTETLRIKLALMQREVNKLKRIEYMYCRLTDKDRLGNGPIAPVTMKELASFERDSHDGGASYAQAKGAPRRRHTTGSSHPTASSQDPNDSDGGGSGSAGQHGGDYQHKFTQNEEKELSAVLAGTMDDGAYLDSSDSDDDRDLENLSALYSPSATATMSARSRTNSGGKRASGGGPSGGRKSLPSSTFGSTKNRDFVYPPPSLAPPPFIAGSSNSKPPATAANNQGHNSPTRFPTSLRQTTGQTGFRHSIQPWSTTAQLPPSTTATPAAAPSSPPQTSRPSKSQGGSRVVYAGASTMREFGSGNGGENEDLGLDSFHSAASSDHTRPSSSGGGGMGLYGDDLTLASVPRRSRNPYAISARHDPSSKRRHEKLATQAIKPTPPAAASTLHIVARPNTGPRIHTLNQPQTGGATPITHPLPSQSSTQAILEAAGATN